jgi:hypothetical protein
MVHSMGNRAVADKTMMSYNVCKTVPYQHHEGNKWTSPELHLNSLTVLSCRVTNSLVSTDAHKAMDPPTKRGLGRLGRRAR